MLNETSDAIRAQATGSSKTLNTEASFRDPTLSVGERKNVRPTTIPLLATPPPEDVVQDAHKIASSCNSLEDVRDALNGFHGCPLRRTATNLVLCDGDPRADLMIIGEAPGRDEDVLGKPFVGRSGRLLDHMLSAIGLSRASTDSKYSVFISNCIFWRPPGNRKPTEAETLMCLPFLGRMIEIIDPKFLLFAGSTATARLLNTTQGIMRLHGNWQIYTSPCGKSYRALPTLHPAYLLRQPDHKRLAWRDLMQLKNTISTERL
ncbi:uracil-DNA glycosylase [Rhodoligotrophos appendicifer]|uniref:uracil-DNA glycosylase n=1 Tax=Rhodoligotrophos appendicifer TaxID=987056 RepID=UPI003D175EB8